MEPCVHRRSRAWAAPLLRPSPLREHGCFSPFPSPVVERPCPVTPRRLAPNRLVAALRAGGPDWPMLGKRGAANHRPCLWMGGLAVGGEGQACGRPAQRIQKSQGSLRQKRLDRRVRFSLVTGARLVAIPFCSSGWGKEPEGRRRGAITPLSLAARTAPHHTARLDGGKAPRGGVSVPCTSVFLQQLPPPPSPPRRPP